MENKNFEKVLETLKEGKRYTILATSDFGYPVAQQITYFGGEIRDYAQYKDSLFLNFKPKRQKKLRRRVFHNYYIASNRAVIWEGWVNVDQDAFKQREVRDNGTVVEHWGLAFSNSDKNLDTVKNTVSETPVVEF